MSVHNKLMKVYDDVYVNSSRETEKSNQTIGQRVIDEVLEQYGIAQQIGVAKIKVEQPEENQSAVVTIKTKDFIQLGSINYDDGVLTWDELTKNDEDDVEEIIADTNPDFFIYSPPDSNGNVSIKGLSTGVGGGVEAYQNNDENILNLVIPQKNSDGNTIIKIDSGAFNGRDKIKKLILGEDITGIGNSAFAGCTQLTDITLPITIKVSGDNGKAFEGCQAVSKVKLTKGKNGIGCGYGTIAQNSDYYQKNPWFNAEQEVEVEIAEGVEKIGNNTFKGCSKIQKIKFPKSLKEIGASAFENCTALNGKLKNIENVTSIGGNAFSGCSGINGTLIIPNGVETISNGTFLGTSITKVVIHDNVTKINNSAFKDCIYLKDITLPITINSGGYDGKAFEGCQAVSKVKLTKGKNGIGYGYGTIAQNNDYYQKNPWFNAEQEVEVEIAEGVEKIGNNTFRGCSKIRNVKFPKSLKEIGMAAFENCTALTGELKNIENVTSIGVDAFSGCSGINGTLIIPNGIETISNGAFKGTSITKLVINKNVTKIGNSAFKDCVHLEDLTIPITIKSAGEDGEAFSENNAISKVRLTPGKNDNGEGFNYSSGHYSWSWYYTRTPWYRSTSGSKKIIIEKGVTKIGSLTFEGVENTTYYYTGTEEEWTSVQGTSGITISSENYNYSE